MKAEDDKSEAGEVADLLERQRKEFRDLLHSLIEYVRTIQGDTADRRLQRVTAQLKSLDERFDSLIEIARRESAVGEQESGLELIDRRALDILMAIVENRTHSLNLVCEDLLDRLIEATEAERGFILFYVPESTEADVVAARSFQTRNLSMEEYRFSRSLLREVLQSGDSILLKDASEDRVFSQEASVINLGLKSVLVVPLKQSVRTIGAIYLENSQPSAFDHQSGQFVEIVSQFVGAYLSQSRLLPLTFEQERSVFFDPSRASKEIIGRDPKIASLHEVIARLASSPATVLIQGESGTGKELIARALHYQGARRDRPFVAINCAAIPDNLLESELFGHEKGAFTGATQTYVGRIERGNGGTIFLDEVSELAYPLQAKLLRFLQLNEFDRLGGRQTIRVDVRVVAATSKDLKLLAEAGKFQEALFYRLNVIPLMAPPLRERKADIRLLADHFLKKYSDVYGRTLRIEPEVYEILEEYSFPGNVREMENLIHRLVALAVGDHIGANDLPGEILRTTSQRISLQKDPLYRILATRPSGFDELRRRRKEVKRMLAEQESDLAARAVEEAGGNVTEAAARLGINRVYLHELLRKRKEKQ
ncbi:MAG: sigma-54-dependent Fis family transcriptional regulator [Acidobacteriota bacterium]